MLFHSLIGVLAWQDVIGHSSARSEENSHRGSLFAEDEKKELNCLIKEVESYNASVPLEDDSHVWQNLISQEIAANIGIFFLGGRQSNPLNEILSGSEVTDELGVDRSSTISVTSSLGSTDVEDIDEYDDIIPLAVQLATAVYMQESEIVNTTSLSGILSRQVPDFPLIARVSTASIIGWVFEETPTTLFVSFRGSVSKGEFFKDIDVSLLTIESTAHHQSPRVHAGIYKAYVDIEPALVELLQTNDSGYERVVLIGHSLGGAIATLAGALMPLRHTHGKVDVVTFGSPRVGDSAFVQMYSQYVTNSLRIVNHDDKIPGIYPINPVFEHVHGSTPVRVDGPLVTEPDISDRDRMDNAMKYVLNSQSFFGHGINVYSSRIMNSIL